MEAPQVADDVSEGAALLCSAMACLRAVPFKQRLKAWPPPTSRDAMHALEVDGAARELASAAFDIAMRAHGPLPPIELDTWHTSCFAWAEAESMLRDGWLPGTEP